MSQLFTVFFVIIFVFNSFAQLKLVGRAMPGEAEATFVVDSLCYVTANDQVQIFDVSYPAIPKLLSNISIPGVADDIYVEGDFAYVAAGDSGFCVINISNTLNPLLTSITNVGTSVYGIFYKENRAYLATSDSGLIIYDVVDPFHPIKLGTCNSFHSIWAALNVYVQGNYAYVAAAYDGFIIIDVSNPSDPQQVYLYDQQDFWAYDVKVSGGWAFLSFDTFSSGAGLLTFQIPVNPANTQQIGLGNSNAPARRIDIGNGYAYLACRDGGLNIMNISNPIFPSLVNSWVSGNSNNLFYRNNFVYLADLNRGLFILDVTNVSNIIVSSNYDTHAYSHDIGILGNYMYQTERDPATLKVFDITEKSKPVLLFDETLFPDDGGVASEITVENNYLFMSTYANFTGGDHQFRWYRLTDPTNPQLIGIFDQTTLGIRAHAIEGDRAYLGNSSNLRVLDLSIEQNPIPHLGYFSNNYDFISGVEVRGPLAFLATRSTGFCIVNIEHPSSMFEVGRISTTSETFDIAIEGNYAYLADWEAGFRVVDISNPFQPVVVDSVQRIYEEAVRVAVKNDTAYVSWNNDGIRLYDVSDPTKIVEIGYYITRDPEQIRFDNEYIYLADDEAGIYIFQNDDVSAIYDPDQDKLPQDFYLAQNYPNPFNPTTQIEFNLPQSGQVTLSIYSITGELVKSLVNKNLQAGFYSINWNGENESFAQASSGVYLYKLNYAGHQWVKKMILMH